MQIELNNYGLLDIEWLDYQIARYKHKFPTEYNLAKLALLNEIKQQLIPSIKLADKCFDAGSNVLIEEDDAYGTQYDLEKETFLNSKIEL